jgi:hypothetical protein
VMGNTRTFHCFYSVVTNFVEFNKRRFLSGLQLFVSSNISALFSFLIMAAHSISFSLRYLTLRTLEELILPVQVRIYLLFPCILLSRVFKA